MGLALLATFGLAACDGTGGPALFAGNSGVTRNTPPGADGRRSAEDGLVVGDRLMASGEHELALKAYLRAASEQGINVDVLTSLGSANLALGRLGQAEALLRRAIEADPTYVPAMNNLGVVLMEQDKPAEARLVFQRAYALDSGETDSIRENLRLAIARAEKPVYVADADQEPFTLVQKGESAGGFVTLNDL